MLTAYFVSGKKTTKSFTKVTDNNHSNNHMIYYRLKKLKQK